MYRREGYGSLWLVGSRKNGLFTQELIFEKCLVELVQGLVELVQSLVELVHVRLDSLANFRAARCALARSLAS